MTDKLRRFRSWYGLTAEIAVENRLWHLVRVGGVPLPHPPVVNLILRRGQPERERLYLSYLHEFGHVQTLPVAVGHAILLLFMVRRRKMGILSAVVTFAQVLIAHQALWELAAETFVIFRTKEEYRRIYREHPNAAGLALFWAGALALATFFTKRIQRYTRP